MAYNVNLLTEYVDEQRFPLLKAAVMGARTASLFQIQAGIKHTAALNFLNTSIVIQDDSEGASTAGGGESKFSQRFITVSPLCVREFYDPKKLNNFYTQSQLKAGSAENELAFEKEIMDGIVEQITAANETLLWQGNTALTGASNSNINKFNGYIKLIDSEAEVIKVTGVTLTTANIIAQVDAIYAAIPTEVLKATDMSILMGDDTYRLYTIALKNANMFHYSQEGGDTLTVPGTNIKIYALPGLNETGRVYAMRLSNGVIGCDLEGEEDNAEAVFLPYEERVKIKVSWKYGVQIEEPKEIVTYKVA
jgi:hypothetical protein